MESLERGKLLEREGKYSAALICYDHEINKGGYSVIDATLSKLSLLEKLNRYEEMLTTCDHVLKKNTNDENLLLRKGEILKYYFNNLNQHEMYFYKVIEIINRKISKNPTNPYAYQRKAEILFLLGSYDECFETFELALEFSVNENEVREINLNMGEYLERRYQETDDIIYLKKAVKCYSISFAYGEYSIREHIEYLHSKIEIDEILTGENPLMTDINEINNFIKNYKG